MGPILEHVRPWIPARRGDRSTEAVRLRLQFEAIERLITVADEFAVRFLQGSKVRRKTP